MAIQIGVKSEGSFQEPLLLLRDCHRRIERFLHQLVRILEGHAATESLKGADKEAFETALRYFENAEPLHTADEEESLFPRLRMKQNEEVERILRTLEADHDVVSTLHREVNVIGRKWLQQGLFNEEERQQILEKLHFLQGIYKEHIGIEDNILFPLSSSLLDAGELRAVGEEMARRRGVPFESPPGSRCAGRRARAITVTAQDSVLGMEEKSSGGGDSA